MSFLDEQRLAFGSVAGLYDRARPTYPPGAIDEVMARGGLAAGDRVLEVGAGTGKATELLAARGLVVTALEPSAPMAALLRGKGLEGVTVIESEFESWRTAERFAAVVSMQAWHWIAPHVRYERAASSLTAGGTLAAIWTFPDWSACGERGALAAAYARAAPGLAPTFPMHPGSEPTRLAGDWRAEIGAGARFDDPEVIVHPWSRRYSSAEYVDLLRTHQDHILLAPAERERLLEAVAGTLDAAAGGMLAVPFVTWVCLARRR